MEEKHTIILSAFFMTDTLLVLNDDSVQHEKANKWLQKKLGKAGVLYGFHRLVFPVNIGNMHWGLCNADLHSMELRYFDSLNFGGARYLALFKEFLDAKFPVGHTDCMTRRTTNWKLVRGLSCSSYCLVQNNSVDCGVYMLHVILEIWR